MKKKSAKAKPLYTTHQNILYMIRNIWKWDKMLVFAIVAQIPLIILLQLSGLYIVRLVISLIESNADLLDFIRKTFIFSVGILFAKLINNKLSAKTQWNNILGHFMYLNNEKIIDADYEIIENPDVMNKMQLASQAVFGAAQSIMKDMITMVSSIFIVLSLFAIITSLSPTLLITMVTLTLIQHLINNAGHRWRYKNADKWASFDRKLDHLNFVSGDFERAKDVRLYNLKTWLHDVFFDVLSKRANWYKKAGKVSFFYYDVNQAITQLILCNGITFLYLIANVSNGNISVADAVLYITAIGTLAGVLMDVIYSVGRLNDASLSLCHLREFLDMQDISNRGTGIDLPVSPFDIEFENVSFKYPKSDKNIINNISFKIAKSEKIAIVGRNGAGKTTLVKLISGLYRPSSGKIKINGHEIAEYNRNEYYSLISAVFQDIYIYPVSIAQNIALCEENNIDRIKLLQTIKLAGLEEKIASLPDGENTILLKSVVDNAIEFSGGEKQKLSLARALYKDGLLLILDEPTAALDPIAENEVYIKYNMFSKNKTSIFISHRLSSTRFCDRIFFLDEGRIVETGSHNELMALNGRYAEIFDMQRHYYKEDATSETY